MARITALTDAQAPARSGELLNGVKAKFGKAPNMFRTLAHSPAALNGYLQFSGALAEGVLTAAEREIVALAVGQANQCGYCLSAHTLIGKAAGLSDEAVKSAREGKGTALAALALKLVENRGFLDDDELATARGKGVSDAQILEVIAHVALNTFTNYVNHVAGTDIDFPEVKV